MVQSSNPDWLNQWQGLSRNLVSFWQDMARQAEAAGVPHRSPSPAAGWQHGFEQWARHFSSGGGAQNETIDRIIDSAKSYAAFMQAALASATAAPAMPPNWNDAWRGGFGIPGASPMPFDTSFLNAFQNLQGAGFGAMQPPIANLDDLKGWMSLPAFGLAREHQEHHQKASVAWVEYQEQTARYGALMLKAAQRGFELFEGKLTEREQPGRQIETFRALYDLWVDAAEEGYAEIALSTEFREAYGAMVNAQMRLRSLIQQDVERLSGQLGMPTRSEVDSIGERLQALRRELRASGSDGALAREVAKLRAEVAALKAARASEPPMTSAPAAPDAGGKGKAARKPAAKSAPRRTARKAAKPAARAAAATAPGNFSSRIAQFADASLGKKKPAKAKHS